MSESSTNRPLGVPTVVTAEMLTAGLDAWHRALNAGEDLRGRLLACYAAMAITGGARQVTVSDELPSYGIRAALRKSDDLPARLPEAYRAMVRAAGSGPVERAIPNDRLGDF